MLGSDQMILDKEDLGKADSRLYKFYWATTGYPMTSNGKRNMLKIFFVFDNCAEVSSQIQCKFYGQKQLHI